MKKLILLLLITLIFSCKENKSKIQSPSIIETGELDWLLGKWQRTNDEDGKQTYENWTKKNDLEYVGLGFTMKENDTISKEIMKISKANDKWDLIVVSTGKGGDNSPVSFKIISNNENSFTCENKEIDFPNIIHYEKDGKNLKAYVSNSEMKIPFEFKRLNK